MSAPPKPWRIYYGDGATYEGPPEGAPGTDVQVIAVADPIVGRRLISGNDGSKGYFWFNFEEQEWYGGDLFGLFDYLARPGLKVVKFGRSLRDDVFWPIYERAMRDFDKTTWKPGEFHPGHTTTRGEVVP